MWLYLEFAEVSHDDAVDGNEDEDDAETRHAGRSDHSPQQVQGDSDGHRATPQLLQSNQHGRFKTVMRS